MSTRLRLAFFLFFLAFNLALIAPAFAGVDSWTRGGPYFAWIDDLAFDPSRPGMVYAASRDGLLESDDGGRTWRELPTLDQDGNALQLSGEVVKLAPRDPATLYASRANQLWRSADGGSTWRLLFEERGDGIADLAIDPRDPNVLYVALYGVHDGCPACFEGDVYRSTDGGATWESASEGLRGIDFLTLAIDPAVPGALWVGSDQGLWKSLDRAASWTPASTGIPDGSGVFSLAFHPANPARLWAGTDAGIYRSDDGGALWWTSAEASSLEGVLALVVDPGRPSVIWAGSPCCGLHRSTDGGATWKPVLQEGGALRFEALAFDPGDSSTLVAGSRGGLWRSADRGASWARIDVPASSSGRIDALVADPREVPGTFYASLAGAGIYKSTDQGRTWRSANRGLGSDLISALAVDPVNTAVLYAGSRTGAIFQSRDRGASWRRVADLPATVTVLEFDPEARYRVFAGTSTHGLFITSNRGETWRRSGLQVSEVHAVAADPNGFGVFVASAEGLFRGDANDRGWTALDLGASRPRARGVALHPRRSETLVALTSDGIARSDDGGDTWRFTSAGLGDPPPVMHEILFDPRRPATLYARSHEVIFQSLDGGRLWRRLEPTLPMASARALALHPWSPATLLLASHDGVFDLTRVNCASPTGLCLEDERFLVELVFRDPGGRPGAATRLSRQSADSGLFYFFSKDNWEMLVKVLDGRAFNDHYWVFAAGTTTVEYLLRVVDTATGRVGTWYNPPGQPARAITDTGAFPAASEEKAPAFTPPA